jgi:hypothetical protein
MMVCKQVHVDVCCLTQGVGVHHEVVLGSGFQLGLPNRADSELA